MPSNVKDVLIYRLGSLGDTVIALPSFHLIARTFPNAKRYLLGTSISISKATHPCNILDGTGLIHDYISYPVGLRNPKELLTLRKQIMKIGPDVLIYLAATRGTLKIYRDVLFFRLCGIRKLFGVPYTKDLQNNRWVSEKGRFEYEGERLARCLATIGDARLDDPESWNLHLTKKEGEKAQYLLRTIRGHDKIIACSPGAKVDAKHWGGENWKKLMVHLYRDHNDTVIMFIGTKDEYDECEDVGQCWPGKQINLCGMLTPRESAAALKKAALFIGHDSGPMHLSAAVSVPCVAIFSARNKPGMWYPYGEKHYVLYHQTKCYGCGLEVCNNEEKKCIKSITVEEVLYAMHVILGSIET